jgi:hypothetical protein
MRILCAIKSWQGALKDHEVIRETWGSRLPEHVDLKFFVGGENCPPLKSDEVWVDAPDTYGLLVYKVREMIRYAFEHGYEYLFLADTDTFVLPSLFAVEVPAEYCGELFPAYPPFSEYMAGGHGVFLSRHACEFLSHARIADPYFSPLDPEMEIGEDQWIGKCLDKSPEGIFKMPMKLSGVYTWHGSLIEKNGKYRRVPLQEWCNFLFQTRILKKPAELRWPKDEPDLAIHGVCLGEVVQAPLERYA